MKSSTYIRTALLLLTSGTALVARADYPSTVLSQGPAVYYRLNETTPPPPPTTAANLGSTGATDDGNFVNDPPRGLVGPLGAGFGSAISFDGATEWITSPYDAALSVPNFTVEAWVNPATATPTGGLQCVVADFFATSGTPSLRSGWLIYQSGVSGGVGNGFNFRLYNQNGTATSYSVLGAVTVTPGTWYHVAATYDGTTANVYVDGVLAGSGTFGGGSSTPNYVPNGGGPFEVGARSDNGFPWPGELSEVAYFPTALSASTIAAHFAAATTNAAGYAAQIEAANPLVYYRLNEAGEPAAPNLGTLGAAFNGSYVYNATVGLPGPLPTDGFPGFAADNDSVNFYGDSGYVKIPSLNLNSANVTMTAWVNLQGNTEPGNTAIVFSDFGTTKAGLKFDVSDPNGLSYNWSDPADAAFASGLTVPTGPQWAFVALIVHPDYAVLALEDGTAFTTATNVAPHAALPFLGLTLIGSDAGTLPFTGSIDEVAIFNRSLGLGEVYTEYAAAKGGLAPIVFQDPLGPTNTVYTGDTVTFAVDAGGTPPLYYQWYDGTTLIANATNSVLSLASVALTDSGSYSVIVSNATGSVQSGGASVTVNQLNAPAITVEPVGRTLYPGGTFAPFVVATGGALTYQWKVGSTLIPGATHASYTIASVTGTNSGAYTVTVSNRLGTATSTPAAQLTVIVPAVGSYESIVLSNAPKAWWRLNDAPGSTKMADSMGRFDGSYVGAVTLGAPSVPFATGSTAATFPGVAGNYGEVPYSPVLNSENFSVEAWVQTTNDTGILGVFASYSFSATAPSDGRGYFIQRTSGDFFLGGIGNNDQYQYYYVNMGPEISNKWTQIVVNYGADGLTYYQDGVNTPPGGYQDFVRDTSVPFLIGAIFPGGGGPESYWDGQIADVSYYTTPLTAAQISAHYYGALYGGTTPPVFITQPVSETVVVGQTATFTAHVEGSIPLSRQWLKGASPIAGATNETLTLANAGFTDAATYQLRATNASGTALSDAVTLSVLPQPSFVNATNGLVLHLPFDNSYNDTSGLGNNATPEGSPSFVPGVIGSALAYADSGDGAVNNFVDFPQPPLLLTESQDFSVAYWIQYPTNAYNNENGTNGTATAYQFPVCDLPVFGNATSSTYQPGYCFSQAGETCNGEGNSGGWIWSLVDGNADTVQGFGATHSVDDAKWHSLVFTFKKGDVGITYLDGLEADVTSIASIGDLTGPSSNPAIGNVPGGFYASAGAANLDDFGMWSRVLTPYEAYSIWYVGKNFGRSFDVLAREKLTIQKAGAGYGISWQEGTLLSAPTLSGPWTPVDGATAPFYQFTPTTTGDLFFRVQE